MAFPTIPVLLGAGVLGLLFLSKTDKPIQQTPKPAPPPVPPTLLQQMAVLIQQAQTNPQTASADQMDALANQLEANGNMNGNIMRAWATSVRLSQANLPPRPIPAGQTPVQAGPLLQQYNQLLNQAQNPQSQIIVENMDALADQLSAQGLVTQANILRAEANKARLERSPLPCLTPPCPYGPVKVNRPTLNTESWISAEGTGFIIPNLPANESGHIKVKPIKIDQNNVEVIVLSYKLNSTGQELPVTSPVPIALTIPLSSWKTTNVGFLPTQQMRSPTNFRGRGRN